MDSRRSRGGRDHCARLEEDDGIDPKLDQLRDRADARREARRKNSHADAMLAKLAAGIIESEVCTHSMAIDLGLSVAHVEVVAQGKHIHAWLTASRRVPFTPEQIGHWLVGQAARARAALARTLDRRRTPSVSLHLSESAAQGTTYED